VGAPPTLDVHIDADEAAAALAAAAARHSGGDAAAASWERVRASEGYRRLARREAAMGRPFSDSAFRAFLESDTLAARVPALAATLEQWGRADVGAAARRAAAYLPDGAPIRATVYLVVKPRTNSFVFETGTDSAAIFMYVDPAVRREKLENTLAHELHHVGYARACADTADAPDSSRSADQVRVAALMPWLGAFGEGVAVLAAAGGPDVHPHAVSDSAERARWDRDFANAPADLRRLEAFFLDVLDGRLAEPDSVRQRAMSFLGDAQGPWYTVGYLMAATVERTYGRRALVGALCDPRHLLALYNRAAAARPTAAAPLPTWSPALLARLGT
jgi:Putative zinc dependent peptidase (DUF5700)